MQLKKAHGAKMTQHSKKKKKKKKIIKTKRIIKVVIGIKKISNIEAPCSGSSES